MHFLPVDGVTKMKWQEEGGSNFQALRHALSAPKAPRPTTIQDVASACQSLSVYAGEYFSRDFQGAVGSLVTLSTGLYPGVLHGSIAATIVTCWSDNTSAVSWTNSLKSANKFGQELTRVIGLGEAVFNICVQAKHLPGSTNSAADAASRAWYPNFSDTWTNFCASWYQVEVPERLRRLYRNFSINFNPSHWPSVHESSTLQRGSNESSGAIYWNTRCGFQPTQQSTHTSLLYLPFTAGNSVGTMTVWATLPEPSSPRSVTCRGIISEYLATPSDSCRAIDSPSLVCDAKIPVVPRNRPSAILRRMFKLLDFSSQHDRVLWGAGVLGWFLLPRRPEYMGQGIKVHGFALTRADVQFIEKNGTIATDFDSVAKATILFRGGKADQFYQGTVRSVGHSGIPWLCPIHSLWFLVNNHVHLRLSENRPLCAFSRDKIAQVSSMSSLIKAAAESCGEDPRRYGTHSLRSGGATALFAAGADGNTVEQFGRWKSNAYEGYIRLGDAQEVSLPSQKINTRPSSAPNYGQSRQL
ncbi:hypothetical protein PHMEG_00017250 [Phytophthora megakarya]|uniref:Tyr recombinase domain-containing protein n=1 Tax=Phytophthora megakarya TaxID=4795 RepID=A0A225VYD7_9STRA|nr:hypothetical protein PHMEG_00017250 [Phytophthora megakarya]